MGTPAKSGRAWSSPNSRSVRRGHGGEDEAMIGAMFAESGQGKGGGDLGGDGGGRRDLTATVLEEQIKEMMTKMKLMQTEIDNLTKENMQLKNKKDEVLKKSSLQHQKQDNKATWGGVDRGMWMEDGRWDDDPWKHWKGRDEMTTEDNKWINDDEKWNQKCEGDVKDERTTRVWWGGRIDRRNEMVARGFKRNTHWKEIKSKVEEVMGKSGVTNGGVKVIGQMASFAIIRFDAYENKQEFKRWLQTYGEQVKRERGIWFGENVDKDARARERAVGKVKRALMMATDGRNDVYRDFRRGVVYVGDEVVAKWDEMFKMMMFRGEGKEIRDTYKKLMEEGKREEDQFSE